jgi:hypothetical protein
MKSHANARTCPHSRRLAVERVTREGWTLAAAAGGNGFALGQGDFGLLASGTFATGCAPSVP